MKFSVNHSSKRSIEVKVLIAVASKHGSTREIAEVIAEVLRAEELDVDLRDLREDGEIGEISRYDAVILGSAIYMGNWMPEARHFAEKHQAELSRVPVWLFSSGPLGDANAQPKPDYTLLESPMGDVKFRDHKVFVGKLDPALLGLGEKLMAKVVKAPAGDFRYWVQIREWAMVIAGELSGQKLGTR
jgi:menaquinone-dependent protoporphyrinogen oxidase